MNRKIKVSLFLTGVSAVAGLVLMDRHGVADPLSSVDIELGEPEFGGTGCPDGTVTAVLSPDKTKLSILFDAYVAETQRGKRLDRKSCNVAIPVHIGPGLSMSVIEVDYRGFANIPSGARGSFRAEYFFAGSRGPTVSRNFLPGFTNDFFIEDEVDLLVWTPCGEDTTARANSSIRAEKSSANGPDSYVAIDSMDTTARIEFILQWRRCTR